MIELVHCPICNRTLAAPTTLQCGHSICSHHSAVCCPQNPAQSSAPVTATHTPDVTLNNILDLLQSLDDRPRKRHKRGHSPDQDLLTHLRDAAAQQRSTPHDVPLIQESPPDFDKKLLDELTCHICYLLFYQPVTTPCQHTFCSKCLQRSLDHGSSCPICRQEIPGLYFQDHPLNKTIMNIVLKAYPVLYRERADVIEQEERHARLNTPIFVCQLSFPGIPTVLHVFEPRYRLMLRRCLESPNPFFGMIMSPKAGYPPVDYGTILDIRRVQRLADGRSMVETWGSTRFRILERGVLDGYMVGRIERIYDLRDDFAESLVLNDPTPQPFIQRIASILRQDPPVPSSSSAAASSSSGSTSAASTSSSSASSASASSPSHLPASSSSFNQPTNDQLMDTCRAFLERLQRGAAPWVVQRLSSTYGAMPTDPAMFSFWVALILPIDDREKAKLLPIKSARLRLMLVVRWIEKLNGEWWFSNGCTIL